MQPEEDAASWWGPGLDAVLLQELMEQMAARLPFVLPGAFGLLPGEEQDLRLLSDCS